MDALIMDLRGNGGGHLTEATALSGLFIPSGPIVQLRETGGRVEVLDDPEPTIAWDGPLIVLVDRFSASASEIFAGAIQDYNRGLIVGQQTYGKGSVQNLYPLDRYALGPDPGFGQLTVTIGKYYRVTGESTQHRGVQPDISMPTAISTEEVGESTRDSALPWDRIRPVDFGKAEQMKQTVSLLQQAHDQRIAQDADFRSLMADLDSFEKIRTQKVLSLNLKARMAEREQLEQSRLTRENARRTAHGEQPVAKLSDLTGAEPPDAVLTEATQIAADLSNTGGLYLSKLKPQASTRHRNAAESRLIGKADRCLLIRSVRLGRALLRQQRSRQIPVVVHQHIDAGATPDFKSGNRYRWHRQRTAIESTVARYRVTSISRTGANRIDALLQAAADLQLILADDRHGLTQQRHQPRAIVATAVAHVECPARGGLFRQHRQTTLRQRGHQLLRIRDHRSVHARDVHRWRCLETAVVSRLRWPHGHPTDR